MKRPTMSQALDEAHERIHELELERDALMADVHDLQAAADDLMAFGHALDAVRNLTEEIAIAGTAPTPGAARIAAERRRQIDDEGWTPEHDAEHAACELTQAAFTYAHHAVGQVNGTCDEPAEYGVDPPSWPQEWGGYWNPSDDPVRNLVKAGALIAAEVDRLLAADQPTSPLAQAISKAVAHDDLWDRLYAGWTD